MKQRIIIGGVALILLSLGGLRVANEAFLPSRFSPTGVYDSPNFHDTLPFHGYIDTMRTLLTTIHPHLPDSVIHDIAPFELRPETPTGRGILLVHGLTDTPFNLADIAQEAAQRGYHVRAILLPGHGTTPGDLRYATKEMWRAALSWAITSFQEEVDTLYGVGYSLGGALLLDAAHSHTLDGLGLISPAISLPSISMLTDLLQYITPWFRIRADENPYKYESMSMASMAQTRQVARRVQRKTTSPPHPETPLFITAVAEDATLGDISAVVTLLETWKPAPARGRIYTTSPKENTSQISYHSASRPEQNIFAFSHLTLPYSPHNRYYSTEGSYRFCLHYEEGSTEYLRCRKDDVIYWGEMGLQDSLIFARLAHNPDFDAMTKDLFSFFETTRSESDP